MSIPAGALADGSDEYGAKGAGGSPGRQHQAVRANIVRADESAPNAVSAGFRWEPNPLVDRFEADPAGKRGRKIPAPQKMAAAMATRREPAQLIRSPPANDAIGGLDGEIDTSHG